MRPEGSRIGGEETGREVSARVAAEEGALTTGVRRIARRPDGLAMLHNTVA